MPETQVVAPVHVFPPHWPYNGDWAKAEWTREAIATVVNFILMIDRQCLIMRHWLNNPYEGLIDSFYIYPYSE